MTLLAVTFTSVILNVSEEFPVILSASEESPVILSASEESLPMDTRDSSLRSE